VRLPLRIQLLVVTAAIFAALTATILWVVRQSVRGELRRQIAEATESSASDFVHLQQQQSAELARSATLLAELPILKSLMTAPDSATIQDASTEFRDLSDTDLLLLARPNGEVAAVHVGGGGGMSYASAGKLLQASLQRREEAGLWQEGNEIYLAVTRPIISGVGAESNTLGYLVLGKRIDDSVAKELGSFAGSEVLLTAGEAVIASTQRFDAAQLQAIYRHTGDGSDVRLGDRHYAVARVNLPANSPTPINCYLLLSLTTWDAFLNRLNQMVLVLGAIAVFGAVVLVLLISRAITGPLESLVAAVRALAEGNYQYSLHPRGSSEVAELGSAFNTMRRQLLDSQRKQLEGERLAALGRAAGSISHDLRHQLAAVVANAEFLYNVDELKFDREEIYLEVRRGAAQMTELIDSLVEISRDKPNLAPLPANLGKVVRRAADSVLALPDLRHCRIEIIERCHTNGVFDARKLERAFFNLLLNACEARSDHKAHVTVEVSSTSHAFDCRIRDNGEGVPDSIRATLFEPFVSAGKNNGTGLGLAIARKIVEDHGGELLLESTSLQGSVFLVRLPDEAPASQTVPAIASRATT
jgi:signal transduction histidine kinase